MADEILDLTNEDVEDPAPASAAPRRGFDRRTVGICATVALLVAVVAGAITAAALSNGSQPTASLSEAVAVPNNVEFIRFDGTKGKLTDYDGQNLVVNFFASTCVPCRKEMPDLQKIQVATGDAVTLIGIAVQDDPGEAAALVRDTGVTYDIAQDPTGELFNEAGGTLLPFTLFVSADGTIMDRHSGALTEAELQQKISSSLLAGG